MRATHLEAYPWCVDCLSSEEEVKATQVDHIKPHHGDHDLFFDDANLQSMCKPHHSKKTRNEVWGV